jgi:hypothetical protein
MANIKPRPLVAQEMLERRQKAATRQYAFAPEGHLIVAQRFIAGWTDAPIFAPVPEGRVKTAMCVAIQLSLRDNGIGLAFSDPAMNRWAIFDRPSGTKKRKLTPLAIDCRPFGTQQRSER